MDTTEGAIEAEVAIEAHRDGPGIRRDSIGKKATEIAKPGLDLPRSPIRDEGHDPFDDEETPLLNREAGDGDEDDRRQSTIGDDFANMPWYKRPSIWWVLAPFFLMACAFGGSITPKINLILELVCREYMSERMMKDPNYVMIPVDFNNGDNGQCRIPEVQSRVSILMLWGSLLAGGFSAITSPKLGALSDRYGRKLILVLTSTGTIASELITIYAATYPETFPPNLLLIGFAIDGITGSFIVAMAIANAYAADCTPASRRAVAFGYFHGALFTGIAVGPVVAGYIVKATGRIVVIFWILLGVHLFFMSFIGLVVPESLSKKRQLAAREKHKGILREWAPNADWINYMRSLNILEPLKVLWPTGPGSSPALRRNLFFLAAVDTIVFGVAMGSMTVIITYTNYMFGWGSFESGRFLTIVNSSRVFCLIILLPLLTHLVRGKPTASRLLKAKGADSFDINIIRAAVLFDTAGYLGYTLSRTGPMMILSGAVAAIGGIASPTLQASLTKHVPSDQTGQLLGATSLLHALARVIAPAIFNAIYAGTVKSFPQTVFVSLTATFGLAFLTSWFLQTNGMFKDTYLTCLSCSDAD